ncbi:hypothetical protein [Aliivibrio fischeri]|uniref:hypothetical protein n=1 Tax=Aliivibrio fischeri TaxID=668 RepID=UPI0007C535A8|nr:hypothetical protein [Aliivibrio fischeri]
MNQMNFRRSTLSLFVTVALLSSVSAHASQSEELGALDRLEYEVNAGTLPNFSGLINNWNTWSSLYAVSMKTSNTCGEFDPLVSIENSFKQTKGRVKKMLSALPGALSSMLNPTSLAAAGLQRSSPQTYEMLMQGISIGFEDFNLAKDMCEAGQKAILDTIPTGEYQKVAKSEVVQGANSLLSRGHKVDIMDLFSDDGGSKSNGNNGFKTPAGNRGGNNQPPFELNLTAEYGYDNLKAVLNDSGVLPINGMKPKSLSDYFPNKSSISDYIDRLVGSVKIRTCEECSQYEKIPGVGMQALVVEDAPSFYNDLVNIVTKDLNQITKDDLNMVSVHPLLNVNLSVIEAIKAEPIAIKQMELSRLAYDLSAAMHIQKATYAKMSLLAGQASPEFSNNGAVKKDVSKQIALLDSEITSIVTQAQVKSVLNNSSPMRILKRKEIKNQYSEIIKTTPSGGTGK